VTGFGAPMQLDSYLDAAVALIGLPIPAECRPGVLENLERMQQLAALVMEFPLPADIEAAETFRP
jgi:hypothetical protein